MIFPDDVRRTFVAVASRVDLLFRTIGIDEQVEEYAADRRTIRESILDSLPKVYSDELYEEKCSQIYESYYGDEASKYAARPGS